LPVARGDYDTVVTIWVCRKLYDLTHPPKWFIAVLVPKQMALPLAMCDVTAGIDATLARSKLS
jgi:hypothetical protein